jgi:hypothetical protein
LNEAKAKNLKEQDYWGGFILDEMKIQVHFLLQLHAYCMNLWLKDLQHICCIMIMHMQVTIISICMIALIATFGM